jgi:hypothetical protein
MEENTNKEETVEKECFCTKPSKNSKCSSANSCIYGLGLIGALIFFLSQSTTFWTGVLAILKAIVWPAFMVYELLNFLIK